MKFLKLKITRIISIVFLVLLVSLSLSATSLMNFPAFYHHNSQERIITVLISMVVLSVPVIYILKSLIFPNLICFKKVKNIIFIVILFIFLSATISISSNYYWSVPETQDIKICFDADDATSNISIRELNHPVTNQLYPPDSFGSSRYPFPIESGECINGTVMTFYRRIMRFWNKPGISVVIQGDPPDGRLFVSANEIPSVLDFDNNSEAGKNTIITIYEGFDLGEKIEVPWNQHWFLGIRVLAVFISAAFLSLFLFGLTEKIIGFSSNNKNRNEIFSAPFFKRIKFYKPQIYKVLLGFTIVYFIIFGILMVHTDGQPDQSPHRYFSIRFSETWGIPEEDLSNNRIITGKPYLAYWIYGAVYKIVNIILPNNTISRIQLWRLVSVFISTVTVYYLYKLATKATGNPYAGVLAAFFLGNTMMFVFISGGISYDNLMNLAGMAAIYHLVCLFKKEDFVYNTAFIGIWVAVGSLSKEQFLLLTLIIFLAWLFFVVRNFRNIHPNFNRKNIVITLIFLVAIGFFVGLYGTNLIRYSRTTPMCKQIIGEDRCNSFDYRWEFFNKISYPGLWFKRDTFQNPINYIFDFWSMLEIQSTWGILSHNTFMPKLSTALHSVLILWSFLCLTRYWNFHDTVANVLIFVLLGFVGYVFLFNYKQDIEFNFHHYGVTGRYMFPIIGALLTLMVYYLLKIRSYLVKRISIILAILINFYGGLGLYLSRYSEVFVHWRVYFYK